MPPPARAKWPRLAFRCPCSPQTPVSIQDYFWWVILLIRSKWHLPRAAGTAPHPSLCPRRAHERLAQRGLQWAGYSFQKSLLTLPTTASACLQPLLVQTTLCQLDMLNGYNDVTKILRLIYTSSSQWHNLLSGKQGLFKMISVKWKENCNSASKMMLNRVI